MCLAEQDCMPFEVTTVTRLLGSLTKRSTIIKVIKEGSNEVLLKYGKRDPDYNLGKKNIGSIGSDILNT